MTSAEKLFNETGAAIKGSELSQMFGKPCFKVNGKAFCCFFQDEMVFKLEGTIHESALSLKGSKRFDPSGKKKTNERGVQVSFAHKAKWSELATSAMKYVKSST